MTSHKVPHLASLFFTRHYRNRRHLSSSNYRISRHFFVDHFRMRFHDERTIAMRNGRCVAPKSCTPKNSEQSFLEKQRGRDGARCFLKNSISSWHASPLKGDSSPQEKEDARRVSNLMVETNAFAIRIATRGPESLLRLAEPSRGPFTRAPRRELSPATPELPTSRPDSYLTDLAAPVRGSQPHASARDVGATLHSHAGGVTVDGRLPSCSTAPPPLSAQ